METIVGIDFGTTNSEVAVFEGGRARVLTGREGERVIPSAVYIDEDGTPHVGVSARNVAILRPERTVLSVKRELGSGRSHRIDGRDYPAVEIASMVFAELKLTAERYLGQPVHKAVVTVPAYYDDPQRQATKQAAALAGLEVVRLVNEPTAAAMAYGIDSGSGGTIVVYDLGGGTFDVSILSVADGVFQVLATRGDTHLGGDDFDRKTSELLFEHFLEENGIDLRTDPLAVQKVLREAEGAKKELSSYDTTKIELPFIAANLQGPCHLSDRLEREELERLISSSIIRTRRLTKGALQDAGIGADEVDRVVLVGGSTHIPAVQRAVNELFGRSPEVGVNPEEIVACGAAAEASILAGGTERKVLVDVTPLGLGVETADGAMETIVPRNTVLPTAAKAVFTTVSDYQHSARITVVQGERPRAEDNTRLGSFRLSELEHARQGQPDIEIEFEIDVEGIVHVKAKDLRTGSSKSVALEAERELSDERVRELVNEAREAEIDELFSLQGSGRQL